MTSDDIERDQQFERLTELVMAAPARSRAGRGD